MTKDHIVWAITPQGHVEGRLGDFRIVVRPEKSRRGWGYDSFDAKGCRGGGANMGFTQAVADAESDLLWHAEHVSKKAANA